jgi:segregation and condensation protein B
MRRRAHASPSLDTELDDLPPELIWRVWMGRVEAVIFASPTTVTRETLSRVVGKGCNLDALIEDIRAELADRPYELVAVAGGWQHRTRAKYADAIRAAAGLEDRALELSRLETLVVTAIAYFQPTTRRDLGAMLGREISRDTLADLRSLGLIANGPKSPRAGGPNTYVTTATFLSRFGFNSLQELPDREAIETAWQQALRDGYKEELVDLFGRELDPVDGVGENERLYEEAEFE